MRGLLTILILSCTIQLTYSQISVVVEQSVCDPYTTDLYEMRERIVSREVKNDSLIIVLGIREICCATFVAECEAKEDTLKIIYRNSGDECFCTCFYNLTFKIAQIQTDTFQITFNGLQFKQSDSIYSEYVTKIDTLENGNILRSKYENDELILEVEFQESLIVYRQYYNGIFRKEFIIKREYSKRK
jgi:hypothetical protein